MRINAVTEPNGLLDLLALRDYPVKPDIVLIPKVESPRDLEIVEAVLSRQCPRWNCFALIETPRGLRTARSIVTAPVAAAGRGLRFRRLRRGARDRPGLGAAGLRPREVVNGARAAQRGRDRLALFDLHDPALLRRGVRARARALGFSGKMALHPYQVPVINEVFSPDTAEIQHAQRIVSAAQRSGQGITTVGGSMVGRPFFEASRRLLEEFEPLQHRCTSRSARTLT